MAKKDKFSEHGAVNRKAVRDAAILDALKDIEKEYNKARIHHPAMNSGHEGYAVIKEELDELWDNIKANVGDSPASRKEAIQIAAMALAYVLEVCE